VLFLIGAVVTLTFLVVLTALGLLFMTLFSLVIGAERLLAALFPAYRHRRRGRYLVIPVSVRGMVRLAPGHREAIEASSFELPEQH
jgi:hypothetical protein